MRFSKISRIWPTSYQKLTLYQNGAVHQEAGRLKRFALLTSPTGEPKLVIRHSQAKTFNSRNQIAKNAQEYYHTCAYLKFNKITKNCTINSFVLDAMLDPIPRLEKAQDLIKKIEEEAKNQGMKRIFTDWTILPPSFAQKADFRQIGATKINKAGTKLYRYEKDLPAK